MSHGLKYVSQDLRRELEEKHTLLVKVLEEEALYIERRAKEIVPVDSGKLRDSINVRVSRSPRYPGLIATASAVNIKTGYNYALIQHENPDYHHDAPGQYHYIEEPYEEAVERIMEKL